MKRYILISGRKLIIIGAGGHGRVVEDIAGKMKRWDSIVFLEDRADVLEVRKDAVIGKSFEAERFLKEADFFIGIGNNEVRERLLEHLLQKDARIPVLAHPGATIGENVTLGAGTIVMPGAVINCNTSIGKGCIINTGATVDHDTVIEDYVHISPGAHLAGNVRIGSKTWLGIGTVVSNHILITGNCIVGAGTLVIKNITEEGIYYGSPAIKRKESGREDCVVHSSK